MKVRHHLSFRHFAMNSAAKTFCLVLVGSALLAGCSKKPMRPDPSATVIGPQGGGGGGNLNPQDVATSPDASGLQSRDMSFDANGQLRGALDSVYFEFNESSIKPAERAKLQAAKDIFPRSSNAA